MTDEIRVKVNSFGPDRPLGLVFRDPISGRKIARSSGTTDWRAAERAAALWQAELRAGQDHSPSKIRWKVFVEKYKAECLSSLAVKTRESATGSLNLLERLFSPDRLSKLTPAVMSRFQSELRKKGMKETTIAHHLRHIKAALRWAERVGLMVKAPKIEMPKRAKGQTMMKGRPLCEEEFDRLLAAVPKVRPQDAEAWQHFLMGVWLSGLRLGEAVALSWDFDAPFAVDLSGRRPVFRIRGEAQKSGRDQILPMTPDFAEWLTSNFPPDQREGRVFNLRGPRGPLAVHRVGEVIVKIGKRAGIVTNKAEGKSASCHDLRRSFGTRWAKRVMPAMLQRLMRHADISTTMDFYVSLDADAVADELWANFGSQEGNGNSGNTCGNTCPISEKKDSQPMAASPYAEDTSVSGQGRD